MFATKMIALMLLALAGIGFMVQTYEATTTTLPECKSKMEAQIRANYARVIPAYTKEGKKATDNLVAIHIATALKNGRFDNVSSCMDAVRSLKIIARR
jgi:hypothetical protein